MTESSLPLDHYRNPLIGHQIDDTQLNIQAAMSLLKLLQDTSDRQGIELTPLSNQGLALFNSCILQAIEYEMSSCPNNEE